MSSHAVLGSGQMSGSHLFIIDQFDLSYIVSQYLINDNKKLNIT